MDIEIIGLVGFVFAATAAGALLHERRMDVLYGPYIERRANRRRASSANAISRPVQRLADLLRWKARNAVYLGAIAAC
ncbi:hypothetical protein [Bradyrhizobium sp.]|uniref:hypothetical protein n=1 Tax=Bradyrhizobium sp. TaxID=376 RepID=UPI003C58641B